MTELPNPDPSSGQDLPRDPLDAGLAIAFGAQPALQGGISVREHTQDYQGSRVAPGEPVRRITMALIPGPTPQLTDRKSVV